ncbi:Wzz/FepE/Etk N-terminal domain-containing protein [Parapedobacter soli]|uniref:Wzz/FepE/Etk N-terminal domain-containing protein n=1 Tax=Parapedobacter soli TaxID=416955 RepID=UPI0021C87F28|nr:Wzz/FepE/Etk N-terminal domain-containing protein [Parapedobacter soli]
MATEPTPHIEDDELSVKELILNIQEWIRYLWSKWKILLIAGIVGSIAGLGYSLWKKPLYTATTTFVLEGGDSKSGLSQYAGMAAMVGISLGGGGGLFQGDNILELYKSRSMLEQTLLSKTAPHADELLIERYIAYNGLDEAWAGDPVLATLDFRKDPSELSPKNLRTRDSIITRFVTSINNNLLNVSKPDKNLSIIQVEVTSPDETFSKALNENLVRRVNDFYIRTKTKKSTDNIAILEAKVDSVRTVMTGAIYSAARVSDATPNLNPTRQSQRVVPAQEAQFTAEANQAMLSQLVQNLEMARMAQMQEQPLIQLVDRPVYPLPVERLGKAKGIVIGGFLFGFLTLLTLVGIKWYRDVMAEDEKAPIAAA